MERAIRDARPQSALGTKSLFSESLSCARVGHRVGPYEMEQLLDRGGMANVFLATDQRDRQRVVLKTARTGVSHEANAAAGDRLLRESELLSLVRHPGVVHWRDVGSCSGITFLVLDYVSGQRLDRLLEARNRAVTLAPFPMIVAAVAALHSAGIVHRDLKPGNVVLRRDGEPVLIDLGIAGKTDQPDDPLNQQLCGTALYLAPEQLTANRSGCDPRTDVYQLGLVGFELATGRRFVAESRPDRVFKAVAAPRDPRPQLANARIPSDFVECLCACLAANPADRPASASEVLRCLEKRKQGAAQYSAETKRGFARVVRSELLRVWAMGAGLLGSAGR